MIQGERVQPLNDLDVADGRYVLYWMQRAQRAACNHALEFAVRRADELGLPVLAAFGVTQRYPDANERHYAFMLEGLHEIQSALRERGVRLAVRAEPPMELIPELARYAALVVTDRGYLRVHRHWRREVADAVPCRMVQVEGSVVVPVETASEKEEYAARTIRPKIHEHLDRFLVPLEESGPERDSLDLAPGGLDLSDVDGLLEELQLSRAAWRVSAFRGGTSEARRLLEEFVADKLDRYSEESNEPAADCVSHMSPYLHFGQISPVEVALRVQDAEGALEECKADYLEELIVRRELAINFCHYNPLYDSMKCLPGWAQETLDTHAADEREYTYSAAEFESARTHDPYWNAAQRQMVTLGKMHNYMRMYWAKKILEWSARPQDAWQLLLRLNNTYELDGRDPNGYTGVAWCFGKHDQGWAEREVLGKVRYMSANGLERKFDIEAYVEQVDEIVSERG